MVAGMLFMPVEQQWRKSVTSPLIYGGGRCVIVVDDMFSLSLILCFFIKILNIYLLSNYYWLCPNANQKRLSVGEDSVIQC